MKALAAFLLLAAAPAKALTEPQFTEALEVVRSVYTPLAAARGRTLVIEGLWEHEGSAVILDGQGVFLIRIAGGMARLPEMTQDALALAVCHEVGHLMGGAPRQRYPLTSWVAAEGQADYFATLKCARRVFADPRSAAFTRSAWVDPVVRRACSNALCERSAMAGASLVEVLGRLKSRTAVPRFDTPDFSEAAVTLDAYPSLQCRLDTFFQGALCARGVEENVSGGDPAAGACTAGQGHAVGRRPRCWYAPPQGEPDAPSPEAVAAAKAPTIVIQRLMLPQPDFDGRR